MSGSPLLDSLSGDSLRRLHRGTISNEVDVVALLSRVLAAGVELHSGVDRKSEPRTARIRQVDGDGIVLEAPNIRATGQPQIYLHFELENTRYFFAAPPVSGGGDRPLRLSLPITIYEAERRELLRVSTGPADGSPRVLVSRKGLDSVEARLRDWSYQGMSISLPNDVAARMDSTFSVEVLEGEHSGQQAFASLRRKTTDEELSGWTKLGVEVSAVPHADLFPVRSQKRILDGGIAKRAWRKVALATAVAKRVPSKAGASRPELPDVEVVEYLNCEGQKLVGLVDRGGSGEGGTAVVIPPAWGRTKETWLPLARTLVATFEKFGSPISVLRYDGTNRRGEAFIDPENRAPGDEYLHYRFSRGVEDVCSSLDLVRQKFKPEKVVLVSFSLGAVEARRAATLQAKGSLDGWVSVVGMVDLQSGLRTVSGGVDFAYGQSMGVQFGRHELVGVVSDMDFTGRDAFENGLVFLEDAKQDMAKLEMPVTWIHGKYDAWMDLDRVRTMMSAGDSSARRLYEVPAGHQMRSSTEALETFQLVSSEVLRMALDADTEPVLPDLVDIESRTAAEKTRRPPIALDRAGFWSDYLLGRDRRLGFELMSATSPYRSLMLKQIDQLQLGAGQHVLDCGSGTGDFAVVLAERGAPDGLVLTHLDLVPEALMRSRARLSKFKLPGFVARRVAADLEVGSSSVPVLRESVDAILASLMLSYVKSPGELLQEFFEILRPGGRLVLSSMRRDADISRIYVNSIAELPPDRRRQHFGKSSSEDFDELQRVFLNDAARLMQLEEDGEFRFFDELELSELTAEAGFRVVGVERAFGDPPQAVVLTADRPAR